MIVVNLKECKFQFFKPGESQRSSYEHHQLLQLVKSRSRETRLTVLFQGQSRKEYIFNDMQVGGAGGVVVGVVAVYSLVMIWGLSPCGGVALIHKGLHSF